MPVQHKSGSKLAKAVSTFEIANENLLKDSGVNTLVAASAYTGSGDTEAENYIRNLSNYMKITYNNQKNVSNKYESLVTNYDGSALTEAAYDGIRVQEAVKNIGITKDGMYYGIDLNFTASNALLKLLNFAKITVPAHKIINGTVIIDINGKTKPNSIGKDIFVFELKADGTLTAIGAQGWSMLGKEGNFHWNDGNNLCNETSVGTGITCAGSIFENNLKVIYQ